MASASPNSLMPFSDLVNPSIYPKMCFLSPPAGTLPIPTLIHITFVPGAISAGALPRPFSIIRFAYRIASLGFPFSIRTLKISFIIFLVFPYSQFSEFVIKK